MRLRRLYTTKRLQLGFSLPELLVCIGVIGLLCSLLIPAVQAARESAWSVQCRQRLAEIGKALHSFEDSHQSLPTAFYSNQPSPQFQLLPFLSESAVYEQFNMENWGKGHVVATNATIRSRRLISFVCPSDRTTPTAAQCNYRANIGSDPANIVTNKQAEFSGPFRRDRKPKTQQVLDGLSKTAFFSERWTGTFAQGKKASLRDYTIVESGLLPPNRDAAILLCNQLASDPLSSFSTDFGSGWDIGQFRDTLYSHALPPNSRVVDCGNSPPLYYAIVTARSAHSAGVHVLFGDGSTTFTEDNIDLTLWRRLGDVDDGGI